jgi:hypothetical protein
MNLGAYKANSQIWSRISGGRKGKSVKDLRSLGFEIGNGKEWREDVAFTEDEP